MNDEGGVKQSACAHRAEVKANRIALVRMQRHHQDLCACAWHGKKTEKKYNINSITTGKTSSGVKRCCALTLV